MSASVTRQLAQEKGLQSPSVGQSLAVKPAQSIAARLRPPADWRSHSRLRFVAAAPEEKDSSTQSAPRLTRLRQV